jgi:hypothetical protein
VAPTDLRRAAPVVAVRRRSGTVRGPKVRCHVAATPAGTSGDKRAPAGNPRPRNALWSLQRREFMRNFFTRQKGSSPPVRTRASLPYGREAFFVTTPGADRGATDVTVDPTSELAMQYPDLAPPTAKRSRRSISRCRRTRCSRRWGCFARATTRARPPRSRPASHSSA